MRCLETAAALCGLMPEPAPTVRLPLQSPHFERHDPFGEQHAASEMPRRRRAAVPFQQHIFRLRAWLQSALLSAHAITPHSTYRCAECKLTYCSQWQVATGMSSISLRYVVKLGRQVAKQHYLSRCALSQNVLCIAALASGKIRLDKVQPQCQWRYLCLQAILHSPIRRAVKFSRSSMYL